MVIVAVLIIGSLLGLLNGVMVSNFGIQPFIATLASMFLARGLCLVGVDYPADDELAARNTVTRDVRGSTGCCGG